MSTLRNDRPALEDADTAAGELRKPSDRHDQPGQGANPTPPTPERLREDASDPAHNANPQVQPPRI